MLKAPQHHAIAVRLGSPGEEVFMNLGKYGNTSAATIPFAFGGGFIWASVLLYRGSAVSEAGTITGGGAATDGCNWRAALLSEIPASTLERSASVIKLS